MKKSSIKNKSSQSIRELNIMIKIGQGIISTLDYTEVLQIISDGMSELLEIETAAIYMLENDEDLMLSTTTPPLDPNMPNSFRKAKLSDHPHIQKTILSQKPVLLADTQKCKLTPEEKKVVEMRQLRSLLYFPFVQNNNVLGILILGTCNKSRTYSDHEINLGQTVANQLSVAIQNARLHYDLKNYKDNLEQLVVDRTYELEAANEELKAINEELNQKNELVMHQKEELETTLQHLKDAQVKLIQSEKMVSLGILTAGVAHEINNPLNFIKGAQLGLERFFKNMAPEYTEEVSPLMNGLKVGVERASDIVNGLNQFSRDNKSYDEKCDIHSIIDNCLVMLHNQYKYAIEISKSYEKDLFIVQGNVGKLHQAFINILTNSIQAIEDKGTISIATKRNANSLLITIKDTGYGIKQEHLPHITDPFFTTKEPNKGTGLGLSITYNIIKDHKGQIEFESQVNKGTNVFITLPVLEVK